MKIKLTMLFAALFLLVLVVPRVSSAAKAASCCFEGSPCCVPGAACCTE